MAAITPRDRLSFTLFLAAALHAALILGVGFSSSVNMESSPTIEITLAQFSDPDEPEDAEFAAQANQIGSGTESELLEMTTDQEADFQDNVFQDVTSETLPATEAQLLEKQELLTSLVNPEDAVPTETETPLPPTETQVTQNYEQLAREIASLEARIARERQALAKGPRVKTLTSVSTKTADEAAYLNMWRQKVERIGNANYPAGDLHGDLRMLVVINWDGKLEALRILQSSGHRSLDEAAMRIVRIASPFQDFPVEMRKKYDQLQIIRTWKFSRSGASLGS
ncbi:MAG: energy transducer TonB [Gammaproteobacteria bacterium]|nr:MAG: energy transducer TonB [Gammaproteobacteria bacterium]